MGTVTIHVYDEGRGVQQDFSCDTDTLLRSMRYFKAYLKRVAPNQDVEISVHCDVAVFAWLLRYAKMKPGPERPSLGLGNCLPVLISSHFLEMDELVRECVDFIGQNFSKVTALPLDMSSLAEDIHTAMARVVPEEALEALWERCGGGEDKADDHAQQSAVLVNRLYKHRVELLLRSMHTTLVRCAQCGLLFSAAHRTQLSCPSAKAVVDYRGNVVALHAPEPRWRFQKYLAELRKGGHSWREIYWHIWGYVQTMRCTTCGRHFPVCEARHCTFHPRPPVFAGSKNNGAYPCCGAVAFRFHSTDASQKGCASREHEIDSEAAATGRTPAEHDHVLRLLSLFEELIVIPWEDGQDQLHQQPSRGFSSGLGEDEDEDDEEGEEPEAEERAPPSPRRASRPSTAKSRRGGKELAATVSGSQPVQGKALREGGSTGDESSGGEAGAPNDAPSMTGAYPDGTTSDSDSVDELSGDEGPFQLATRPAEPNAGGGGGEADDSGGEEPPPEQRSFLASLGAGRYTASIRAVTDNNSSSRVKPALQAALFQELIRQDDADRMLALMEHLAAQRVGPVPKSHQPRPRTAAASRCAAPARPGSAAAVARAKSARRSSAFR